MAGWVEGIRRAQSTELVWILDFKQILFIIIIYYYIVYLWLFIHSFMIAL